MTDDDKFRGIEQRFVAVDGRLSRHETRLRDLELQHAGADRDQKHMDQKFAELKADLSEQIKSIKRPLNTVIIAVIVAIIGGFMTFVMQGGLSLGAG